MNWPWEWNAGIVSLAIGYLVSLLLIRWVVLTRKRQPAATVAWILAIVMLPYLGGILFLFFGINRVSRHKARKEAATRKLSRHLPSFGEKEQSQAISGMSESEQRLARVAVKSCDTHPTRFNQVDIYTDTNVALRRIEEAIEAAEKTIHLEYYIWEPDKTGLRVRDLLVERAKAGIRIRFLYDGLGSFLLNRKFFRPMLEAGIAVAPFLPGPTLRERWSINLRSHRKIVVVDGKVGFTGGMNIGDEYHGRNKKLGFWRDTHMRLEGPTVLQLQQVFAEDWFYATNEELTSLDLYPQPSHTDGLTAQVVYGGPVGDVRAMHSLMFAAINEAREQVTLCTSFFVPTDALTVALEAAALRGVKVRILAPGRPEYLWTQLAGRSYYEGLLQAGCVIHEYRKGIYHPKTLTIDGVWSFIGSPNFDARSLMLNFEVGVVMYGPDVAAELEAHYEADLEHAREIVARHWRRRPARQVFLENLCRLFSPVL